MGGRRGTPRSSWSQPEQTQWTAENEEVGTGTSPAPTAAPVVPSRFGQMELLRRADYSLPASYCGWYSGFSSSYVYCVAAGASCTNSGKFRGCCSGPVADCGINTSCIPSSSLSVSQTCGKGTTCCAASTRPICAIDYFSYASDPFVTYTHYGCSSVGRVGPFLWQDSPPYLTMSPLTSSRSSTPSSRSTPTTTSSSSSSSTFSGTAPPATTTSGSAEPVTSGGGGTNTGAIVGGVVGGLAVIGLLVLGLVFLLKKKKAGGNAGGGDTQQMAYSPANGGGPNSGYYVAPPSTTGGYPSPDNAAGYTAYQPGGVMVDNRYSYAAVPAAYGGAYSQQQPQQHYAAEMSPGYSPPPPQQQQPGQYQMAGYPPGVVAVPASYSPGLADKSVSTPTSSTTPLAAQQQQHTGPQQHWQQPQAWSVPAQGGAVQEAPAVNPAGVGNNRAELG